MPTGQEFTKIAIAVAISRPANQSTSSFVITMLRITPPVPATSRPAISHPAEGASATITAPASIATSASTTMRFSPSRAARTPPGSATTAPGAR